MAHRFVWEALVGPIKKKTLDHLCRNRSCVRPSHLREATNRENLLAEGSLSPSNLGRLKTCCAKGHPYDEENTYVDPTGKRHCRECQRAKCRRWWQRNRDAVNARRRVEEVAGA